MKRICLLIPVLMLVLLTACGADNASGEAAGQAECGDAEQRTGNTEGEKIEGDNTAAAERSYETASVLYSEPCGGYSFREDLEKTRTDYGAYYFDPSVSLQERNACIAATDRMLSRIGTGLPELEIVVVKPEFHDGVSVSGNRLFLSPQPWDSLDYLSKVLLAVYGEWGNYGLAYGYADYLCKKAGAEGGNTDVEGGAADSFRQMSAPELYDLNLLCFDERFVSPEDVEAAKNDACLFVREYLSSHSEEEFQELLSASGTGEGIMRANEELEAFYVGKGVECSLTGIRYQYGGLSLDYAAACEYACFYVDRDWQDECWELNPMTSENFLHEDYKTIKDFFECNEHQMQQYQELFGFDSYDNSLLVYIKDLKSTSYYMGEEHKIYLKCVLSLMHEYIHSLMFGHCDRKSSWKNEGFASYFSNKYDMYAYEEYNEDWNNAPDVWVQEYIDTIGRPIDVQIDFPEIWNIRVHAEGYKNPDTTYTTGASFVGYLVDQYGEQATIAYVCSDNEYNAEWDKSYDELVKDWNQYIEDNYSQYSMN